MVIYLATSNFITNDLINSEECLNPLNPSIFNLLKMLSFTRLFTVPRVVPTCLHGLASDSTFKSSCGFFLSDKPLLINLSHLRIIFFSLLLFHKKILIYTDSYNNNLKKEESSIGYI